MATAEAPLRFSHFELHPAERLLRVHGEPVVLGSRAFDLLLVLAQRHERLVRMRNAFLQEVAEATREAAEAVGAKLL